MRSFSQTLDESGPERKLFGLKCRPKMRFVPTGSTKYPNNKRLNAHFCNSMSTAYNKTTYALKKKNVTKVKLGDICGKTWGAMRLLSKSTTRIREVMKKHPPCIYISSRFFDANELSTNTGR
jgi:hypothetical protein